MDNKKSFIKKLLSFGAVALATSTVVVNFALAFFSEQLGTKGGIAYGYRENDLMMQEFLEKYGTYYNDYVKENSSNPFYSYDFSKVNKQFDVNGKNMTDINEMAVGESMYVLIGSNAYIDRQGKENPIGAFLKNNGTSQDQMQFAPTASIIKEEFYNQKNGHSIKDFIWKITKLKSGKFAIASCKSFSGKYNSGGATYNNGYSVLTFSQSKTMCWPSGTYGTKLNDMIPEQSWVLEKCNGSPNYRGDYTNDNKNKYDSISAQDTLYYIKNQGSYLNVKLDGYMGNLESLNRDQWARYDKTAGQNVALGYAVNYFSIETSTLHRGSACVGNNSENEKYLIKQSNTGQQPHRWSEWLILPILQDFDSSVDYGYTGSKNAGITSTISSLSKITPHNADNRKARTYQGNLLYKDLNGDGIYQDGMVNGDYIRDKDETLFYTDGDIINSYPIYRTVNENRFGNRVELERKNAKVYIKGTNTEVFVVDEHYYGKGTMNYDTVFGNNINYNLERNMLGDTQTNGGLGNGNLADSVKGRIVDPDVVSDSSSQMMKLNCEDDDEDKNYMLWTISPNSRSDVWLSANMSFQYRDGNIYGGEKAYVSWSGSTSGKEDMNQNFFIFYSLNSDGGYYMSPVGFNYGSREEESFRIVEIAAYNNPEMLQLWEYKFGSNGRFWIDSGSTDELQAEIVDVLVDFETNGKIKNIDKVYTYWRESTQQTDVLTLKYNSAFYSPAEAEPGKKYDTTRYESQGYYYAFDSASNVSDKNTTCYRLFFRYVGGGQSVIVKNADAINKSKTFTIESFLKDNTKTSPDDRYKPLATSYTYKNSVYAPYQIDIIPDVNVKCCWYVNDKEDLLGAEKVGNGSSSSGTDTFKRSDGATVSISYSFTSVDNSSQQYTRLEVKNPTKLHHGLYFICIVAGGSDYASISFADKLTASEVTKLEAKKCINSGYNRLDVANNILYHNVDRNGIEQGIVEEDWIIYGTDLEIDEASVPFAANGGYIKYDKYFVDDGLAYYERNDGKNVIKRNYKIMNRPATAGETDSDDLGWMLFEATIKNPNSNSTFTFANYIAAYKNYYNGNANVEYVDEGVEHKFWRVKEQISFALSGDLVSGGANKQLVHDTTINLYTERKANIAPEKIKYQVFVDDFGTTFMAKETNENGWTIISTSKETDGKNKFIKGDKIIAPVVAKNSADANSIKLSGGDIQVKDKNGNWVNVDEVSGLDVDDDISMSTASLWCKNYVNSSLNAGNFVDAVEINAIDLLTYYGKSNLQGDFEVVFRFATGSVNTGGWFGTASGEEECCRIKFVPFDYFTLN